jgi:hypothetical protein
MNSNICNDNFNKGKNNNHTLTNADDIEKLASLVVHKFAKHGFKY